MTPEERAAARLHARSAAFARRLAEAERVIAEALARCELWYVAFSGGKDSTVVAALVEEQAPGAGLLYVDEEWLLPETEAFLRQAAARAGPRFHRIKKRDQHAEWFTAWADGGEDVYAEPNVTGRYAASQGWGGAFLGLRADENNRRRRHLRAGGTLFFNRARQMWQANPLAWWSVPDVWAYILSRDLDYNRAYDRLSEIGVPLREQRIGPLAQWRVLERGQLAILRRGWPDLFNRFAARYPEALRYT